MDQFAARQVPRASMLSGLDSALWIFVEEVLANPGGECSVPEVASCERHTLLPLDGVHPPARVENNDGPAAIKLKSLEQENLR
jgi:hypothetical protein